ncbi:MCE family protein [Streptacidiphilus sp. PB12-B1b]|nr:MCE family protein [Streptacidiphilus sp. PB12-B1b]
MSLLRGSTRAAIAAGTALVVVVGGGTAAGLVPLGGGGGIRITAYFSRTIGVYPGSDLRILGVKEGTVESVSPDGTQVRVVLAVDSGVRVPADASAVVVAPTLVADRYVQLTPAYTGGPQLHDHGTIPLARTGSPVEIDQLYQSITQLADALGPNGANTDGALSQLLDTGAANLDGNGAAIGNSISQLGSAAQTLNGNSSELFATLTSLQSFTSMLKQNNSQVQSATGELSTVSGFLAQDRSDLGSALAQLATALGQVQGFIQDNRSRLQGIVDQLVPITQAMAKQRASLAELLTAAPLAADNLLNAYDPAQKSIDGRADLNELSLPMPFPATGGTR